MMKTAVMQEQHISLNIMGPNGSNKRNFLQVTLQHLTISDAQYL